MTTKRMRANSLLRKLGIDTAFSRSCHSLYVYEWLNDNGYVWKGGDWVLRRSRQGMTKVEALEAAERAALAAWNEGKPL